MSIMDEFWSRLGTDDGGMPIHLPIGLTPAEEGPTSDADAHHFACWCGNEQCPLTRALALAHATEFTRAYEDVISRCRRDGNTKMALADLRAKVEALRDKKRPPIEVTGLGDDYWAGVTDAYATVATVLARLEGKP